jgi:hypothetical protein
MGQTLTFMALLHCGLEGCNATEMSKSLSINPTQ